MDHVPGLRLDAVLVHEGPLGGVARPVTVDAPAFAAMRAPVVGADLVASGARHDPRQAGRRVQGAPLKSRGAAFTDRVKAELARHRAPRACCRRAELASILRSAGTFHIVGGERFALEVDVPDAGLARKVYSGLAADFARPAEIRILEPGRGRPRQRFLIRVRGRRAAAPFIDAGVLDGSGTVPVRACPRSWCRGGAARAPTSAARSSLTVRCPSRGRRVQFEIRTPDRATANGVRGLAERVGRRRPRPRAPRCPCPLRSRRAPPSAGCSPRWARTTGTSSGRTAPSGRPSAAKRTGSRTATKPTPAARRAPRWSSGSGPSKRSLGSASDGLPQALREVAHLRLAHPDATLEELGRLCRPPVTKPAVADRLRRLERLAEERAG